MPATNNTFLAYFSFLFFFAAATNSTNETNMTGSAYIDIESFQNRLLKVCYVPASSAGLNRLLFLLWPLTVLMKQTRQVVRTI